MMVYEVSSEHIEMMKNLTLESNVDGLERSLRICKDGDDYYTTEICVGDHCSVSVKTCGYSDTFIEFHTHPAVQEVRSFRDVNNTIRSGTKISCLGISPQKKDTPPYLFCNMVNGTERELLRDAQTLAMRFGLLELTDKGLDTLTKKDREVISRSLYRSVMFSPFLYDEEILRMVFLDEKEDV